MPPETLPILVLLVLLVGAWWAGRASRQRQIERAVQEIEILRRRCDRLRRYLAEAGRRLAHRERK